MALFSPHLLKKTLRQKPSNAAAMVVSIFSAEFSTPNVLIPRVSGSLMKWHENSCMESDEMTSDDMSCTSQSLRLALPKSSPQASNLTMNAKEEVAAAIAF